MIEPERIKEIIDSVNKQYPDLGLECLTGLKPIYDDNGNIEGHTLIIEMLSEVYNLLVGPVAFPQHHFTTESMVEEFAESVVKDIYDRIKRDAEFLDAVNRYKLDFVCNIDTSHKPYTYIKNLPYLPYDDFITECNIVKAGMAQYGLDLVINNASCLSDTSDELYGHIVGTVVRLDN